MKPRGSTIFLRIALAAMGVAVAAFCLVALTLWWVHIPNEFPRDTYAVYAVVIAMSMAAVPFFAGVVKGWSVLQLIDKGEAFSLKAAKALRFIAICAAIVSGVNFVSLPFFYIWAQNVDAPGLMLIGTIMAGVSLVVAVFSAVLQRLLGEAVAIKSENDLTV